MPEVDPQSLRPPYMPWDQRLCVVPAGDLYKAVRSGKAEIVTDRIGGFTPTGIELESGRHLPADIVVTATGLELVAMGNVDITVDGTKVEPNSLYVYKGQMFSGVPNLAWCVGYTNASWTLRADLTWKYVADYLNHLDLHGYAYGTPDPNADFGQDTRLLDLASGYIARADELLPKSGARTPWKVRQNWFLDSWDAKRTDLDEDMIWTRTADLPVNQTAQS
ncbi:MAG TPA: hypothetical protein PLQ19_00930 [Aeromicrobium sp.]|mgnify:CR=1 FL=1|nr:hypothetical protein [Aeromicrobium sp.]